MQHTVTDDGAGLAPAAHREGKPGEPDSIGDGDAALLGALARAAFPAVVADPNQPDCPIVIVNDAFCRLTGYPAADLIGRNCRLLQGEGTDRAVVRQIAETIAAARVGRFELLNYRKDGTPFWNALFLAPLFRPDGTVRLIYASQMDVTLKVQSADVLARFEQLSLVGELAGGFVHDINNLLGVVHNYAQLLDVKLSAQAATGRDQAAPLGYVERILETVDAASRLGDKMLAVARGARGVAASVEPNEIVGRVREIAAQTLGCELDWQLDLAAGLPAVQVDPALFESALLNLAINARDAVTEPRPRAVAGRRGRIVIRTRKGGADPGLPACGYGARWSDRRAVASPCVDISIEDNGVGMSAETLERAVLPLFTTKRPGSGTGFGLAMVKAFVDDAGGSLAIGSAPGQGSLVRLRLPAATDRPRPSG